MSAIRRLVDQLADTALASEVNQRELAQALPRLVDAANLTEADFLEMLFGDPESFVAGIEAAAERYRRESARGLH